MGEVQPSEASLDLAVKQVALAVLSNGLTEAQWAELCKALQVENRCPVYIRGQYHEQYCSPTHPGEQCALPRGHAGGHRWGRGD